MNTHERTPFAAMVCLALIIAGIVLFYANFDWPTGRLGRPPTEREIWLSDVVPMIVAGYVIGLGSIAIARLIFPRSSIKVILYVVVACAVLVSLFYLYLIRAIGEHNIHDWGGIAMYFMAPLAIATWAVMSWWRPKRDAG
jgi:hypothetical protein